MNSDQQNESFDEEVSLDNPHISTIRRLPDSDVRAIFEYLHENKPAPSHLKFVIVPVGSNGLKLSPPSYEFSGKLFDNIAAMEIVFISQCM